jgi:hypothetical protein
MVFLRDLLSSALSGGKHRFPSEVFTAACHGQVKFADSANLTAVKAAPGPASYSCAIRHYGA